MAYPEHSSVQMVRESDIRELAVAVARLEEKIDGIALGERDKGAAVDALTARVSALELAQAAAGGRTEVRKTMLEQYLLPAILTIIGTGIWADWVSRFFSAPPALPH